MRKCLTAIFILCTLTNTKLAWGQKNTTDSLIKLIKQNVSNDTLNTRWELELAAHYIGTAPAEAYQLLKKAATVSKKYKWEKGISETSLLLGNYFQKQQKIDSTKHYFKKGIRHADLSLNKKQQDRALEHMAMLYNKLDMYDSGIIYQLQRLGHLEETKNKELLNVYTQIAMGYYHLSDIPNTLAYTAKGIKLSKSNKDLKSQQSLTNVLAATLKQKGELDSALRIFDTVLTLAQANNDKFGALSAYNNMANIYGDKGNYPKALDFYLLTLKTADELKHEMAQAVTYNNIAIVYYTLQDYPQTIYYLKKSLKISVKNENKPNIANTTNNIGELYLKQDSATKALQYYTQAGKIARQLNDLSLINQNYHGKALVYDKLKQTDSAYQYHTLALKSALQLDSKQELSKAYIGLAKHFLSRNNYQQTANFAQKAFDLARSLGKVETIRDAAEILHQANAHMVRHKLAYEYLTLYNKMNDSLLSADNTKEITQLEMQYKHQKEIQEREAQEKIIEVERQKEIAKQKIIRNTFIIAFLMVSIFVIIIIRNTKQKQKANRLLAKQKAEIEEKNEELQQLMSEISLQKKQIENSHTKITDSIRYAQRIQNALFPLSGNIKENVGDHLILYKPLNIVSGDFYWVERIHNHLLIAVADCTGHGVPGAMMSMLGIAFLNEIARQPEVREPAMVLEKLRKRVKNSLHQTGKITETRDGMDIAFIAIDISAGILSYSGANNPVYIFRNNELTEIKADKQPIAIFHREKPFTNHYFKLEKGDTIYIFTDGYKDQFNGSGQKKYGTPRFKKLLQEIHNLEMEQQYQILNMEIDNWMNNSNNQLDDILVAGFRWQGTNE